MLSEQVLKHGRGHWKAIFNSGALPGRSYEAIYAQFKQSEAQTQTHKRPKRKRVAGLGDWTAAEKRVLSEQVLQHPTPWNGRLGTNWKAIAQTGALPGRTAESCRNQYRSVVVPAMAAIVPPPPTAPPPAIVRAIVPPEPTSPPPPP